MEAPTTLTSLTEFKPNLFVLPWGLYPRRILIYLAERNLLSTVRIIPLSISQTTGGMVPPPGYPTPPKGTVPILEISPGVYLRQSLAILQYLERTYPPPGAAVTPFAAARVTELLSAIDETCSFLGVWLHQSSAIFAGVEVQHEDAARVGMNTAKKQLGVLEALAEPTGVWLDGGKEPTIADCVLAATALFMAHFYGFDLCEGRERLSRVVDAFKKRPSTRLEPENEAPRILRETARVLSVKPDWTVVQPLEKAK